MRVQADEQNQLYTRYNNLDQADKANQQNKQQNSDKVSGGKHSIFAGDLLTLPVSIADRREKAREQARKMVADQFASDSQMDDSMKELSDRIDALNNENADAHKEIDNLNTEKAELKQQYGVADNSQEQKDLELLEKDMFKDSKTVFTDEEASRLEYLRSNPDERTAYQQMALSRDTSISLQEKSIEQNTNQIEALNAGVRGIKLERLKSDPMLTVQKNAETLEKAADKQVISDTMQQAMDTVDAKAEEEKKKAEDAKEEQDQKEEQIEEQQMENEAARTQGTEAAAVSTDETQNTADTTDTEEVLQTVADAQQKQDEVQANLKELMKKQKLLEDDLKGIEVDEQL